MIVTASDTKLSWGFASSDEFFKVVRIHHPFWLGMIAGEDISVAVESLTRLIADTLADYKEEPPTAIQVRAAIVGGWRDIQNQVGQSKVLNHLGIDVRTFQEKGFRRLGSGQFADLSFKLAQESKLKCDLMVVGFDEQKIPTLFVCNDDYPFCADCSRHGQVAIGSGHDMATAVLSLQEYSVNADMQTAIYQVCVAKFAAEKADAVGQTTIVACLAADGRTGWVEGDPIEALRKIWNEAGRPRLPATERIAYLTDAVRWSDL